MDTSDDGIPISPARHQSNIRNILNEVKSGKKNKSEAFSELRNILNSSAVKKLGADMRIDYNEIELENSAYEESKGHNTDNNDNNNDNINISNVQIPSRFSQEDRRLLINKLIEKKKRNEEEGNKNSSNSNNIIEGKEIQSKLNYLKDEEEYITNANNGNNYNENNQYINNQNKNRWNESEIRKNDRTDARYENDRDREDAFEEKGICNRRIFSFL